MLEGEKKSKELQLLNKESEMKENELSQQRIIRNIFLIGFLIVLIMVLFVVRSNREKNKANIAVVKKNQIIEQKNKDILDSIHYAKRIQQSLMPNEKYLDRIFKKLKGGM